MKNRNKQTTRKRLRPEWENTCNYCLYYHPDPQRRAKTSGNCSYHNEWIECCDFTTCSDMSPQPLEPGIYELTATPTGDWAYNRRRKRIRTRLFVMEGGRGGKCAGGRRKGDAR